MGGRHKYKILHQINLCKSVSPHEFNQGERVGRKEDQGLSDEPWAPMMRARKEEETVGKAERVGYRDGRNCGWCWAPKH